MKNINIFLKLGRERISSCMELLYTPVPVLRLYQLLLPLLTEKEDLVVRLAAAKETLIILTL